jgi:hypothetical protein
VTTRVEVLKTSRATKVRLAAALPVETPFLRTLENRFRADGGAAKLVEGKSDGLGIVAAEFPAGVRPLLTLTSRVVNRNYAVDFGIPTMRPKKDFAELEY